ncbi:hypothetical protein ACFRKE_36710, partial [Kitasatospora indigofera]|uniref:hypothetical protein n=1 Tax=Kitasatospora indigofera TaxID=67307 RepID=UPI0036B7DC91
MIRRPFTGPGGARTVLAVAVPRHREEAHGRLAKPATGPDAIPEGVLPWSKGDRKRIRPGPAHEVR